MVSIIVVVVVDGRGVMVVIRVVGAVVTGVATMVVVVVVEDWGAWVVHVFCVVFCVCECGVLVCWLVFCFPDRDRQAESGELGKRAVVVWVVVLQNDWIQASCRIEVYSRSSIPNRHLQKFSSLRRSGKILSATKKFATKTTNLHFRSN